MINKIRFTQEQLTKVARLSDEDMELIADCRGEHNKLGLGYQLCYIKLFNRFPTYNPITVIDELASFVAIQLDVSLEQLTRYADQKATFFRHQDAICTHLNVKKYDQSDSKALAQFLIQQAQQIQATESLFVMATDYLRERKVLSPADYTIERLIQTQRDKARTVVFENIARVTTPAFDKR